MDNNYRTLHKDIGLIQRTNNGWDLWFENGDIVQATKSHSLQVGIILACLTSWNYLNRYGNPTYTEFGNRAYQLLKTNKSSMTSYKIQQFFLECLQRMRRIYEIVSLTVSELPHEPYTYFVEFEVISISNQLVDGSFTVSTDTSKSSSFINYEVLMPYASNTNPLTIDLYLQNEYGGGLSNEILYMYLKKGDGDYEFVGLTDKTDADGYVRVTYTPTDFNGDCVLYFDFKGNTHHNPTSSQRTIFKTELYDYSINFIEKDNENPLLTIKEENILHIQILETSQLTNETIPKQQATLLVKGDDGSVYEAITNFEGIATITTKQKQTLTNYTAYYSDSTETIQVEVTQLTPLIDEISLEEEYYIYDAFVIDTNLYDEYERPVQNNEVTITYTEPTTIINQNYEEETIDEEKTVTVTTDKNGRIYATISLNILQEYTFTITTTETIFHSSITEQITLEIQKYNTTLQLESDKESYFNDEIITLTGTVQCLTGKVIPKTMPLTIDVYTIQDEEENIISTEIVDNNMQIHLLTTPQKLGFDDGQYHCDANIFARLNVTEYNIEDIVQIEIGILPHQYRISVENMGVVEEDDE